MMKCKDCNKVYPSVAVELGEVKDTCKECGGLLVVHNKKKEQLMGKQEMIARLMELRARNRAKLEKTTVGVDPDVQAKVDEYIELDAEMKNLQALMKELKADIEEYMQDNNVSIITGSVRGAVSLKPTNRAPISARFTSYNVDEVAPLLDAKAKRQVIVKAVDRDALELLIKNGQVDDEVTQYKIMIPTVQFTTNHR